LCIRAKLRGSPKALVTKVVEETLQPAWLMTQGMVISLKMKVTEMGYRGSKSVIGEIITVKEQRVDGSSIFMSYTKYCKVYSKASGNPVYRLIYNKIIIEFILSLFI